MLSDEDVAGHAAVVLDSCSVDLIRLALSHYHRLGTLAFVPGRFTNELTTSEECYRIVRRRLPALGDGDLRRVFEHLDALDQLTRI